MMSRGKITRYMSFVIITCTIGILTTSYPNTDSMNSNTNTVLSNIFPVLSRLSILMYHAVDDNVFGEKELFVSVSSFDEQMKYLSENGYTAIDFTEIKDYNKYNKPVLITFDDGYSDIYTNAYPILKKYRLKATVFLVSGYIGSSKFLTSEQIKEMSDIISFQSHTIDHPMLTEITKDNVEKECSDSKAAIMEITGKPVIALAYPHGAYNKDVIKIVSQYYKYAITSDFGYYRSWNYNYTVKRVGVSYLFTLKDFVNKLQWNIGFLLSVP